MTLRLDTDSGNPTTAAAASALSAHDEPIKGVYRTRIVHPTGTVMEYSTPTIPLAQIPEWIGGPVEKLDVVYLDKIKQCYILRDNIAKMDTLDYNEPLTHMWAEALRRRGLNLVCRRTGRLYIRGLRIYGIGVICFDYSVTLTEPWDLQSYRSRYPHGVELDH